MLITTAVVGVWFEPAAANADPVTFALVANGASFWGAAAATYGSFAVAAIRIGAGLIFSYLGRPAAPDLPSLKFDIQAPTSLPAKRYLYGNFPMTGTPAPWRVNGSRLYGCLILNSRPSAGTNFSLTIDGRKCSIHSGDLFDFSGPGAKIEIEESFPDWDPTEQQFLCWLGLGDQTGPPADIVSKVPDLFSASDAWQGQTVLWVSISAGGSEEKRAKRWPNGVPQIEVRMDWSLVWSPNAPSQDKDDPATWTYSDNQARCLLDAIRQNPMRAYTDEQILLDQFTFAVEVANNQIPLWHASIAAGAEVTEPRYRVATAIDWSKGELMDLIRPLADAGAGRLTTIGGRIGYIPGDYQAPVYTMSDILDDQPVTFTVLGPKRDVPFALKGTWTSAENSFETAELAPILVSGGSTRPDHIDDWDLPAVPSGTQAQRVTQIEARRRAAQKRLTCVLPPNAIKLLPGSGVTGACPAPFTRFNIGWQVLEANPGVWLQDGDSGKVAFRVPVTMAEESAFIYDWDPETNEQIIESEDLVAIPGPLGSVANLAAATVEINSAGATILMIEFSFDPITNAVVDQYEVAWREDGETMFIPLPDIPANAIDDFGNVSGRFGPVEFGVAYDLGVRPSGPTSEGEWAYVYGITAGLGVASAAGTPVPGGLDVTGTAPGTTIFKGFRLFRADVGDTYDDAVKVGQQILVEPGEVFDITFGPDFATDIVTDGGFDTPASWTLEEPGWSVSGSKALHSDASAADGRISQVHSMTAGAVYRMSVDVQAFTGAGNALFQILGDTVVGSPSFTGTGVVVRELTAPANPTAIAIRAQTTRGLTLDDMMVVRSVAGMLPAGMGHYWLVPVTVTNSLGTPYDLGVQRIP
ncbi:phage tail protein [Puniceibacterium confluentis]|uniref:phage tail protein n=1 Tax=Puniceibacterium confluentis TaxID=1958944 RepID=UPI001C93D4DA|nr:phage tail protein [Puniceibacterium confluentis]